jgi:urease accessory protein
MRAEAAASAIFAANRAAGRIALEVAAGDGATRRRRVFEDGPLRARFPNVPAGPLEAVIVNTAGGIAGGDRSRIEVSVTDLGKLVVTTAAAEKVYRSLGPDSEIAVRLKIEGGATLSWLPQETILFDRARLTRSIEADLTDDASLLVAEAVVFGRTAMGETMEHGAFTDRWRIRRNGRLIFAETLRLDGSIALLRAEAAVMAGAGAIATVLATPADESRIDAVRAQSFCGEAGISAWNGLAVARLCAKDGASLRHDLGVTLTALGATLPRLWLQ